MYRNLVFTAPADVRAWWSHGMETLLALCEGFHRSLADVSLKRRLNNQRPVIERQCKEYLTERWRGCWASGRPSALQWRHNEHDGVSNHQPHDCLLKRLFRCRSRKHQSYASPAFVRGIHQWPVNSPQKGSVTQKMFPFDDVIMWNHSVYGVVWYHNFDFCGTSKAFAILQTTF